MTDEKDRNEAEGPRSQDRRDSAGESGGNMGAGRSGREDCDAIQRPTRFTRACASASSHKGAAPNTRPAISLAWMKRCRSTRSSAWMVSPAACTSISARISQKAVRPPRLAGSPIRRRGSATLHRRRQHVAAAPHGLDERRVAPVILQLAT